MEVIQAIYGRRAVRSYLDQPIDKAIIEKLIEAAIQAPSAQNSQPWAFAIVQDRKLLVDYSARAKAHALANMHLDAHAKEFEAMLSQSDFDIFYGAPALIIICAKPGGMEPAEDCSLAAQNLMLAAHSMGLGTCPIGFARMWLNLPNIKKELGIPEVYSPVFPVIVGFQDEPPHPVDRKPAEIIFWT